MSYKICVLLLAAVCLVGCGSSGKLSTTSSSSNGSTTLSAQTGNNTSTASHFGSQPNGNLGTNNVSKVNVHNLLYPGHSTKVLAMLLWFGPSNHMNVGYSSTDPAEVQRQVEDMISRGRWCDPGLVRSEQRYRSSHATGNA